MGLRRVVVISLVLVFFLAAPGPAVAGIKTPLTGFPVRVAELPFTDSPILPISMRPIPEQFMGFLVAGNPDGNISLYAEGYENGEQLWTGVRSLPFEGYPVGPLALVSVDPNPSGEVSFTLALVYNDSPVTATGVSPRIFGAGFGMARARVFGGRSLSSVLLSMVYGMFGPLTFTSPPVGADVDGDGSKEGNVTVIRNGQAYLHSVNPNTGRPPPGYTETSQGPAEFASRGVFSVYEESIYYQNGIAHQYELFVSRVRKHGDVATIFQRIVEHYTREESSFGMCQAELSAQGRGSELVIGQGSTLHVLEDRNGTTATYAPGFPVQVEGSIYDVSMIRTEINGTQQTAILVQTYGNEYHCYSATGQHIWTGSPPSYGGGGETRSGRPRQDTASVSDPICADITGDGVPEILFSYGTEVIVLDGSGNVINGPDGSDPDRYDTGAPLTTSPIVFDINGDGLLEIAVAGSNTDGGGWFWAWPTSSPTSAPQPWPMAYQNPQRNAVMP